MTCPKCHGEMRQYERNSVTIDQCGDCRGIFLDRGELERLVDAENAWHGAPVPPPPPPPPSYQAQAPYQQQGYQQGYPQQHGGYHPKKKRKSFLDELFD